MQIRLNYRPNTFKQTQWVINNTASRVFEIAKNTASSFAKEAVWKHTLIGQDPQDFKNNNNQLRISPKGVVNEVILKCENARIEFLNPKIDVQKKNYIVSTRVINSPGLIKEFVQTDDYNVTISGDLIFEKECFPYDELKKLNEILSINRELNVASKFFEIFGIEKLVFKEVKFNQSTVKYMNVLPFSIVFDSDLDYDFLIQN